MADYPLSSGSFVRPYRSPWGAFPMKTVVPISTAAINLGQLVTTNWTGSTSAGQVVQSSAVNSFYGVGIAASSFTFVSSAVTPLPMSVWDANPMVEFAARTGLATLQSSHIGLRKKLMWDSTLNIHFVDLTASTATDWRVVITDLIDQPGDSGGLVAFRFLTHGAEQWNSTIASSTPLLAFYS